MAIPSRLGAFEVLSLLGEVGMGRVERKAHRLPSSCSLLWLTDRSER